MAKSKTTWDAFPEIKKDSKKKQKKEMKAAKKAWDKPPRIF